MISLTPLTRYLNSNNFLRSIGNLKIDISRTSLTGYVSGVHWQAGQGTSLFNLEFYMSTEEGNTQQVSFLVHSVSSVTEEVVHTVNSLPEFASNIQEDKIWIWKSADHSSVTSYQHRLNSAERILTRNNRDCSWKTVAVVS
jgi:hypothetical protein